MSTEQVLMLVSMTAAGVFTIGIVTWQLVLYINRVQRDLRETTSEIDAARLEDGRDVRNKLDHDISSLDEKFNKIRDSMSGIKDNYVRRDDLAIVIQRMETAQEALMSQITRLQEKMDAVLMRLIRHPEQEPRNVR